MLSFAWPWVFLALPLPWLLYRWLPPAIPQQSALKVPFFNELANVAHRRQQGVFQYLRLSLLSCIWLLVVIAAARPQTLEGSLIMPTDARSLFLVVDISNSMHTEDISENGRFISRMQAVQSLLDSIIQQRPADRIGLIIFASQPYVVSPTTLDHSTLRYWLENSQIGMAGSNTAIGDAIGLAIKHIQDAQDDKTLLLITDGASNSGVIAPITAATLAAQERIKIHSLGVGTPDTQLTVDVLDEALLQDVSTQTGGQYFRLQNSSQLEGLASIFEQLEPSQQPQRIYQAHELYTWPLSFALILTLLLSLQRLWGSSRSHSGGQHG